MCVCVQKVALDVANSSSVLNSLKHFEYMDANGKDHVRVLLFSSHCFLIQIAIRNDSCAGSEH